MDLPQILSCGRSRNDQPTRDHVHPGLELVLVEGGTARLNTAAGDLRGKAGTLFILPVGSHHDQRCTAGTVTWYLVSTPWPGWDEAVPTSIHLAQGDPIRRWMPDLIRLHLRHGHSPSLRHLLSAILERLAGLRVGATPGGLLPPPLQRIMAAIRRDPLTIRGIPDMARRARVSASHLRHLFARHVGVSPLEWSRLQRLQVAQKLLRSSFLSVADIADQTGWTDANYFTRYFRIRTGMTPRAWRAEHRHLSRARPRPRS